MTAALVILYVHTGIVSCCSYCISYVVCLQYAGTYSTRDKDVYITVVTMYQYNLLITEYCEVHVLCKYIGK